jgi:hypothetical protein
MTWMGLSKINVTNLVTNVDFLILLVYVQC